MLRAHSRCGLAAILGLLVLLVGCGSNHSTISAVPPPNFTSSAPTAALEGGVYTYNLAATAPSAGTISFSLTAGPNGAAISGNTLTWTPLAGQARIANAFTVTAKTSEGGTGAQSWTVTPAGTIVGHEIVTYIDQNGNKSPAPFDLSNSIIAAHVNNGSGSYTLYPGHGNSDGTFSIVGVPAGNYFLQVDSSWQLTDGSSINLDYELGGRADVTYAQVSPAVYFSFTGIDPSITRPRFAFFDPNVDWSGLGFYFGGLSNDGSGTFIGAGWWTSALMDSTKGDLGYFYTQSASALGPSTAQYSFGPVSLNMTEGEAVQITGAVTTVPQDLSVEIASKESSFVALRPSMAATPSYAAAVFSAYSAPFGRTHPGAFQKRRILNWTGTSTNDYDLGTIPYGNPLPPTWTTFYMAEDYVEKDYLLPGTSNMDPFAASTIVMSTTAPSATAPMEPAVGPATNVTIDGRNFLNDQTGISATPTIAWEAPAVGKPTYYEVVIYSLTAFEDYTTDTPVGWLLTTDKKVTLPAGLFQPGGSYAVYLASESEPYLFHTLFQDPTPDYAQSSLLSGILTVAGSSLQNAKAQPESHKALSPMLMHSPRVPEIIKRHSQMQSEAKEHLAGSANLLTY